MGLSNDYFPLVNTVMDSASRATLRLEKNYLV